MSFRAFKHDNYRKPGKGQHCKAGTRVVKLVEREKSRSEVARFELVP